MISDHDIKQLELKANDIRKDIIEMLVAAGFWHTAGPLCVGGVFLTLFFYIFYIFSHKN